MPAADFLSRVLDVRGVARAAGDPITPDSFGRGLDLFGRRTKSGVSVTEENAIGISTVFICARIINDMISTLPSGTFRRRGGFREEIPTPSWIADPGRLSQVQLIGQIIMSLLLWGNGYVVTLRQDGRIIGLDILDPAKVTVNGNGTFTVQLGDGTTATVGPETIAHITWLMLPGRNVGLSPVGAMRETLGLAKASTEYGASFFGSGAVPGAVISSPSSMSDTAARLFIDTWKSLHQGVDNAQSVALLTEGATLDTVSISAKDSQFLETRRFGAAEIGAMFGVPLWLLNMEGPQFGDTISEQGTALVTHTARPHIVRLDALFTRLMMTDGHGPDVFFKLVVDGLMRGDFTQRFATYNSGITVGMLTINEARALEDLPPVPWGDKPISVQVQEGAGGDPEPEDEEITE